MNKLNNKAMTLVELLIAFSLLIVVSLSIFGLITKVNQDLEEKEKIKEITDYSNIMNRKIHTDLIKKSPFAVIYKNKEEDSFVCKSDYNCNINTDTVSLSKDDINGSLDLKKECSDTYPCLVFAYMDNDKVLFRNLVLNINNEKLEYGIRYDNVFEPINVSDIRFGKDREYLSVDDKGFLIIDYPIYLVGETNNLGFKIAYPLLDKE